MSQKYYKVVTTANQSLGLRRNPTILTFPVHRWVKSPTVSVGKTDQGGVWVAQGLSQARGLSRYMLKKYNQETKIYETQIGKILYENSYRVKTTKVKLIKEIK
jgi:hypothetical protein